MQNQSIEQSLARFKDGAPGPQTPLTFAVEEIAIAACAKLGPPYFFGGKVWHEQEVILFNVGKRTIDGSAWYSIYGITPDYLSRADIVDLLMTWIAQSDNASL